MESIVIAVETIELHSSQTLTHYQIVSMGNSAVVISHST